MAYNVTFYLPLVFLSFVCWVAAPCFYVVFMRQRASKPILKVVTPAALLLPFVYESVLIVRHVLWSLQFA
jgi:hypothetical protein